MSTKTSEVVMAINQAQAVFYFVMCALGAAGWAWVFFDLYKKGIVGGMFLWAAFGCIFTVVIIGSSWEGLQTLIQYRKYNKTFNVKAGDCISTYRRSK